MGLGAFVSVYGFSEIGITHPDRKITPRTCYLIVQPVAHTAASQKRSSNAAVLIQVNPALCRKSKCGVKGSTCYRSVSTRIVLQLSDTLDKVGCPVSTSPKPAEKMCWQAQKSHARSIAKPIPSSISGSAKIARRPWPSN